MCDEDDETRDRAAISVSILEDAMAANPYVPPPEDAEAEDIPEDVPVQGDAAAYVLLEAMPMSFDKLERSMTAYMNTPVSMGAPEAITFDTLPIVEDTAEEIAEAYRGQRCVPPTHSRSPGLGRPSPWPKQIPLTPSPLTQARCLGQLGPCNPPDATQE